MIKPKKLQSKDEWVEIFPYGVTIAADDRRPVLIFKDSKEKIVLPVWLSTLDAHMALSGDSEGLRSQSSHGVSLKVLKSLCPVMLIIVLSAIPLFLIIVINDLLAVCVEIRSLNFLINLTC